MVMLKTPKMMFFPLSLLITYIQYQVSPISPAQELDDDWGNFDMNSMKQKPLNIRDFISYNEDNIINLLSEISIDKSLQTNKIINYNLKIMVMAGTNEKMGDALSRNSEHSFAHLQVTKYTTDSTGWKSYKRPMYIYVTRNAQKNKSGSVFLVLSDYVAESNESNYIMVLSKQLTMLYKLEDIVSCPYTKNRTKSGKTIYRFDISSLLYAETSCVKFIPTIKKSKIFFPETKYIEYFTYNKLRASHPISVTNGDTTIYYKSVVHFFDRNKEKLDITYEALRKRLSRGKGECCITTKSGKKIAIKSRK